MKKKLLERLINNLLQARWIVSLPDDLNGVGGGELGLRIAGVNLWYYKWGEPMIAPDIKWRFAEKREFGEVVRSLKF